MDTSNKIRVTDQHERQMEKTNSGGVRDPSDPKHYPPLGGIEGAVSPVGPAERRLSPLGSFKDSLMSLPAIDKIQVESDGSSGSKASMTSLPGIGYPAVKSLKPLSQMTQQAPLGSCQWRAVTSMSL